MRDLEVELGFVTKDAKLVVVGGLLAETFTVERREVGDLLTDSCVVDGDDLGTLPRRKEAQKMTTGRGRMIEIEVSNTFAVVKVGSFRMRRTRLFKVVEVETAIETSVKATFDRLVDRTACTE